MTGATVCQPGSCLFAFYFYAKQYKIGIMLKETICCSFFSVLFFFQLLPRAFKHITESESG